MSEACDPDTRREAGVTAGATHLPQLHEHRLVEVLQEVAVPVAHLLARCRQVVVLQGTLAEHRNEE